MRRLNTAEILYTIVCIKWITLKVLIDHNLINIYTYKHLNKLTIVLYTRIFYTDGWRAIWDRISSLERETRWVLFAWFATSGRSTWWTRRCIHSVKIKCRWTLYRLNRSIRLSFPFTRTRIFWWLSSFSLFLVSLFFHPIIISIFSHT